MHRTHYTAALPSSMQANSKLKCLCHWDENESIIIQQACCILFESKILTTFTLLLKHRESRFGLTYSTQFCDNTYRNIEIEIRLYGGAENKGVDNNDRKTYNKQQGNIKWIGEGILLKDKYVRKQGEGFFPSWFQRFQYIILGSTASGYREEKESDRQEAWTGSHPQEHHLALQLLNPSSFHFPKFPQPLKIALPTEDQAVKTWACGRHSILKQ